MEDLWQTGGAPTDGPRFSVVWRGYDRHQVEEYVQQLQNAAARPADAEPVDRELSSIDQQLAEFFAKEEAPRMFDVVLRGYDRKEVDRYLEQFGR
jgi:cell division septum initiation protein DivIVA